MTDRIQELPTDRHFKDLSKTLLYMVHFIMKINQKPFKFVILFSEIGQGCRPTLKIVSNNKNCGTIGSFTIRYGTFSTYSRPLHKLVSVLLTMNPLGETFMSLEIFLIPSN